MPCLDKAKAGASVEVEPVESNQNSSELGEGQDSQELETNSDQRDPTRREK